MRKRADSAGLRAFLRDESGQLSVVLAVSVLPALAAAGASIDYSRAIGAKSYLQAAVDSAVLGAQLQDITSNAALQTYVQQQVTISDVAVTSATYTAASTQMCATISLSVPTMIMKLIRVNSITATASACSVNASSSTATYEIAMALDNTGSMSVSDNVTHVSKISSEIAAAKNFVNQVFNAAGSSNVQMSLVPFTTAVNVGTGYSNASWMDTSGQSSVHWENFPKQNTAAEQAWNPQSRFDLFSQINQSWAGCVEERPQPYTLTDAASDPSKPDTLFVPLFATDESDGPNKGYKSYNSYLSDNGGYCATGDAYATIDKTGAFKDGASFFGDGQQKLCKYAIKWAANNPTTAGTATSSVQSAISTFMTSSYVNSHRDQNNWNMGATSNTYWCGYGNNDAYCTLTGDQIASLIVDNNLYSVSANNTTVSFCTQFSVSTDRSNNLYVSSSNACYSYGGYHNQNQTLQTNSSASLPASYVNNPQGAPSANNAVSQSGYTASSTMTPWGGSGWNYGGNGWGTGSGWGWGGSTGGNSSNACGFNSSTNNPGYTAAGASSSLYIGTNQFNIGGGANSGCDSTLQPLTTLTSNKGALTSSLVQMQANGATNLVSGLLWAWRTISPTGPFAASGSPRPYGTANNRKILVFMTDGFNNWEPDDSQNGGVYSAFGYYHNNRIGSLTLANGATASAATASNNRSYLDAAFVQACANAKSAGVEIYTVAFSIANAPIDAQGQAALKSCASDIGHFMVATDGNSLNTFFSSIGQAIMQKNIRLVN